MNNCKVTENSLPTDQNAVLNIACQLYNQSLIPQTDMGEAIYEWMDSQVENLSSVRLAEILCWAERMVFVDSCFIKAAKQELIKRGHYEPSRSWRVIG